MQEVKVCFQILPNQLRPFSRNDKPLVRRPRGAISLHDYDAIGQRPDEWRHGVVDLTPPAIREHLFALAAGGEHVRRIKPSP